MMTHDELARAAAGGDRSALDELLHRAEARIRTVCRRITGNEDAVDDATQRALLDVYRKIGTFQSRSSFSTWLHRVATNAAFAELRDRRRHPRSADDTILAAARPAPWADRRSAATEDVVAARLEAAAVLRRLPVEFRAAMALRHLGDFDYAAIADTLALPVGTVRSRLHRATHDSRRRRILATAA